MTPHRTGSNGTGRAFLKERAYEKIKDRLLVGDYAPGTFLSERQLAESLGMSKTPVKAALERLEAEGFITVSPQQGIVVRELSVREIADLYEIRAALESYTLRAIAGKLSPEQVARVRENLRAYSSLRAAGRMGDGAKLDAEFHLQFAEFLGNGEILRTTIRLRDKMQRVVTQVFRLSPVRLDTSYDEHAAIVDAVVGGHGARAAELIVRHLEIGKQLLLCSR